MANEFVIKKGFHSKADSQVTGSLIVSGSLQAFNQTDTSVIIGKDTAPNEVATSTHQVIIGNEAAGTGTLSAAIGNVLVGYQAGYEIDGGDYNVCIGWKPGYLVDGPTGLIAIGREVMRNSVNNYGVGIGYYAGRFQQNNPNVLVGAQAGYGKSDESSDGRFNIAMGYNTAYSLRDGYYNTIIGDEAGYNINNGYSNIFIGRDAGYNVTDGTGNIIIGSGSLGEAALEQQLRIGNGESITTISASLATGDIIFPSTASAAVFSGSTYYGDGSNLSVEQTITGYADSVGNATFGVGNARQTMFACSMVGISEQGACLIMNKDCTIKRVQVKWLGDTAPTIHPTAGTVEWELGKLTDPTDQSYTEQATINYTSVLALPNLDMSSVPDNGTFLYKDSGPISAQYSDGDILVLYYTTGSGVNWGVTTKGMTISMTMMS